MSTRTRAPVIRAPAPPWAPALGSFAPAQKDGTRPNRSPSGARARHRRSRLAKLGDRGPLENGHEGRCAAVDWCRGEVLDSHRWEERSLEPRRSIVVDHQLDFLLPGDKSLCRALHALEYGLLPAGADAPPRVSGRFTPRRIRCHRPIEEANRAIGSLPQGASDGCNLRTIARSEGSPSTRDDGQAAVAATASSAPAFSPSANRWHASRRPRGIGSARRPCGWLRGWRGDVELGRSRGPVGGSERQ